MRLLCYCGEMIDITEEDLGFDEVECPQCGLTNPCPETEEELFECNAATRGEIDSISRPKHVRLMARGEDGKEFCIRNGLDADSDLLDFVLVGAQASYPEATLWYETEEIMVRYFTE